MFLQHKGAHTESRAAQKQGGFPDLASSVPISPFLSPFWDFPIFWGAGFFCLQLEFFCLQSSLLAYRSLRCLSGAFSHCKQKSSNCKQKKNSNCKQKKNSNRKQKGSKCKQKVPKHNCEQKAHCRPPFFGGVFPDFQGLSRFVLLFYNSWPIQSTYKEQSQKGPSCLLHQFRNPGHKHLLNLAFLSVFSGKYRK